MRKQLIFKILCLCLAFGQINCSKKEEDKKDAPQPLIPEPNQIVCRVNNTEWRTQKMPVIIPLRFTMINTPYYFYKIADVKSGTTRDSINFYIPIPNLNAFPEKKTYTFENPPGQPVGSGPKADLFFNGKKYTTTTYLYNNIDKGIKTAGTITIESYEIRNNRPSKITGTFNAKMHAEDGSEITVVDGAFKDLSLP